MSSFDLATWNVLHRVHAENWGEAVPRRFPREAERIEAIAVRVAELLSAGCSVICLQEVSGDQLASLRRALPLQSLFAFRYPRVPAPRGGALHVATLADPSEHLVTVVAEGISAEEIGAFAFADDGGKGSLSVRLSTGCVATNTHVTYRRPAQLARLATEAKSHGGPVVVAGDFNADRGSVASVFGADFAFAELAPSGLPTRPRAEGEKSQTIDHVFVLRTSVEAAYVVDAEGTSDHNVVIARLSTQ